MGGCPSVCPSDSPINQQQQRRVAGLLLSSGISGMTWLSIDSGRRPTCGSGQCCVESRGATLNKTLLFCNKLLKISFILLTNVTRIAFSALTLSVRKSIRPVKIEWYGVGVVICLEQGADCLHMVQLMPLPYRNPIVSCLV